MSVPDVEVAHRIGRVCVGPPGLTMVPVDAQVPVSGASGDPVAARLGREAVRDGLITPPQARPTSPVQTFGARP